VKRLDALSFVVVILFRHRKFVFLRRLAGFETARVVSNETARVSRTASGIVFRSRRTSPLSEKKATRRRGRRPGDAGGTRALDPPPAVEAPLFGASVS
jgi:hypothetical protein